MNKITQIIIWIIFVFLFSGIILITFVELYPFKVAEFQNPLKVENKVVKAGDFLVYNRSSNKYIEATATVSCEFDDDLIYRLPTRVSNIPIGDYDDKVQVQIPEDLPPSDYTYKCLIDYKLFGIRDVAIDMFTEQFTVTK